MGLTEKERFQKWEAKLQEWMPEPPHDWKALFAERDHIRELRKKAKQR